MADRPDMFGPTRGFSGTADSMEPCKMLLDRPLLLWQLNYTGRRDPVAYQLVSVYVSAGADAKYLIDVKGTQKINKLKIKLLNKVRASLSPQTEMNEKLYS